VSAFEDELDAIIARFASRDASGAIDALFAFARAHEDEQCDDALAALCSKLDDIADPQCAAFFATAAGALVEAGASASELARAVVEPVRDALHDAARLLERAPDRHEDGAQHEIGEWQLSQESLHEIARDDAACVQAWFSLANWYRPAVAAWTRSPEALVQIQQDAALRAALAALGHATETSHWLGLLFGAVFDARLVVTFPELREAWSVGIDGVVDIGQLSVLLAVALADPIARIDAASPLEGDIADVMRGPGPQQGKGSYGCRFHLYPTEAIDPADGLPKDGRHRWLAPGGSGEHSLPPDFLVGDITPRDGARVLVLVGPNTPGKRFVRVIGAVRTFDKLVARVDRAERLSDVDARRWLSSPS
jgi:hypothetical protein